MQDYIAMVMLWFATQSTGEVNNVLQEKEVNDQLERIVKLLDKVATS